MHKFKITPNIVNIANEYADKVKQDATNIKAKVKLQALYEALNNDTCVVSQGSCRRTIIIPKPNNIYAQYVNQIITDYDSLLVAHPNLFHTIKDSYDNILDSSAKELLVRMTYTDSITNPQEPKIYENVRFVDLIIDLLGYDIVQSSIFSDYLNKINIRTCVYCNSQYAVATKEGAPMYELDHFIPKSLAPYLCTSFFNLQPTCGPCNKRKSNHEFEHGSYNLSIWKESADNKEDAFKFELDKVKLAKYLVKSGIKSSDDIEVKFLPARKDANIKLLHKDIEDHFHISSLYSQFNDIAEEVVWRHLIYTESYIDSFKARFRRLLPTIKEKADRIILSTYSERDEIFKRPLTKMIQDIDLQLKGK